MYTANNKVQNLKLYTFGVQKISFNLWGNQFIRGDRLIIISLTNIRDINHYLYHT
jgi:hypothetical protein